MRPFDPPSPLVYLSPDGSGLCPSIAELTLSVLRASQQLKHHSLRAGVAKQPLYWLHGLPIPETRAGDYQLLIITTSPRYGQGAPPSSVPTGFERMCQVASTSAIYEFNGEPLIQEIAGKIQRHYALLCRRFSAWNRQSASG